MGWTTRIPAPGAEDSHGNTAGIAQAGLTWRVAPGCPTAAGRAIYRAPGHHETDFKSINLGGGVTLAGIPDLDPEKSRSQEYTCAKRGALLASANSLPTGWTT